MVGVLACTQHGLNSVLKVSNVCWHVLAVAWHHISPEQTILYALQHDVWIKNLSIAQQGHHAVEDGQLLTRGGH